MALIPPVPPGSPIGSSHWADWYEKVRRAINNAAAIAWSQITDFSGSNLTNLSIREHNSLQNIQGGATNDYYHLTQTRYNAVNAGVDATVTLAKLTGGGANGSLTVTKGIITAYSAPT